MTVTLANKQSFGAAMEMLFAKNSIDPLTISLVAYLYITGRELKGDVLKYR